MVVYAVENKKAVLSKKDWTLDIIYGCVFVTKSLYVFRMGIVYFLYVSLVVCILESLYVVSNIK